MTSSDARVSPVDVDTRVRQENLNYVSVATRGSVVQRGVVTLQYGIRTV